MKHQIPLVILELIQPKIDDNSSLIKSVKNAEVLYDIRDKQEESDFFFQIVRQENSNGHLGYVLEFKPKNRFESKKHQVWTKWESILNYLQDWVSLIESYNSIYTVYDDPILKSNQEKFEQQFQSLDPDAAYASFDLNQQLFLDEYLNSVKDKLLELANVSDESKKDKLNELHNDAVDIQSRITLESKKDIIKRLSKFWGKAQKIGLEVITKIFVDVVSEITKKLIVGP